MSDAIMRSVQSKVRARVVLPCVMLAFLSALDRANVSFAALHMNADLGMSPSVYGLGAGIFFIGYLAFQFPSTLLLDKMQARYWIAGSILVWGTVATSMAFLQTPTQFWIARFLLGVGEAGFAPGIVLYLNRWIPARARAGAFAWPMLSIPISIIIGGPLSGWLLSMTNPLGMTSWRWMFLAEGAPALVLAILALGYFRDGPADAPWLSSEEKAWLQDDLEQDRKARTIAQVARKAQVFASPRVWLAAAVWFCLLTSAYGIIFWLPQALKQMSDLTPMEIGWLSAAPWVAIGAGMFCNSWASDRTGRRFWHVGVPAVFGAVMLATIPSLGFTPAAFVFLTLAGLGLGAAQGAFWAAPMTFLNGAAVTVGVTLINLTGSTGGLVAPPAIGAIREATGGFAAAVYAMAALMALAAPLLALIAFLGRGPQGEREGKR